MTSCIFEFVYNARPDSVVDGYSVHEARVEMGRYLAKKYPVEADVVISVPDSGNDAAIGYAEQSGIPYGLGLIKNKEGHTQNEFIIDKNSNIHLKNRKIFKEKFVKN